MPATRTAPPRAATSPLTERLRAAGIVAPRTTVREAKRVGLPLELACALLEKESSGGRNIYGHDPTIFAGAGKVTRANYADYKRRRIASGNKLMQGVGPCQLTWWELQDAADADGGCWHPEVNMRVGFRHLATLVAALRPLRGRAPVQRQRGGGGGLQPRPAGQGAPLGGDRRRAAGREAGGPREDERREAARAEAARAEAARREAARGEAARGAERAGDGGGPAPARGRVRRGLARAGRPRSPPAPQAARRDRRARGPLQRPRARGPHGPARGARPHRRPPRDARHAQRAPRRAGAPTRRPPRRPPRPRSRARRPSRPPRPPGRRPRRRSCASSRRSTRAGGSSRTS